MKNHSAQFLNSVHSRRVFKKWSERQIVSWITKINSYKLNINIISWVDRVRARARQQTRVMHNKHGKSSLRASERSNGWTYLLPSQRTCCSLNYQTLVYPAYSDLQSAPKNKQQKKIHLNLIVTQRATIRL